MYPSTVMGRVNHVGIYIFSFNEASVRVNKNENRQTKKQAKQIEGKNDRGNKQIITKFKYLLVLNG